MNEPVEPEVIEVQQPNSQKKRTFPHLRLLILYELSKGQTTINQISVSTGINWKTVDNHMVFLLGKNYAKEVFFSQYVKIVEITDKGKKYLEAGQQKFEQLFAKEVGQ